LKNQKKVKVKSSKSKKRWKLNNQNLLSKSMLYAKIR